MGNCESESEIDYTTEVWESEPVMTITKNTERYVLQNMQRGAKSQITDYTRRGVPATYDLIHGHPNISREAAVRGFRNVVLKYYRQLKISPGLQPRVDIIVRKDHCRVVIRWD